MTDQKTSTFTIDHDRCDPETWTPLDVLALNRFIKFGGVRYAAPLARLGLQLVVSEHHVPVGGTLQPVGWAEPDWEGEYRDDLGEVADDQDVTPVVRVYLGPVEYARRIPIGGDDGYVEGYEYDTKPTEAEAAAIFAELSDDSAQRETFFNPDGDGDPRAD